MCIFTRAIFKSMKKQKLLHKPVVFWSNKMNFILQLKAFREISIQKKLSANAVALYFEIFSEFNEKAFPTTLKISNSQIFASTSLSRRQLERARNELVDNNLIIYQGTQSRLAGTYLLVDYSNYDKTNKVERTTTKLTKCSEELRQNKQSNCDKTNKVEPVPPNPLNKDKNILKDSHNNCSIYINKDGTIKPEYWSESQLKFNKAFPDKAINYDIPTDVNIELLIKKINQSEFIKSQKRFDLKWCVLHHVSIEIGYYDDYQKKQSDAISQQESTFMTHSFSKQELDSLFDNINEVNLV